MDELKIQSLIESLKVLHSDSDYELRELVKKELAKELNIDYRG